MAEVVFKCDVCGGAQKPLFTTYYCPTCEERELASASRGSFLYKSPHECDHPGRAMYEYDRKIWCRACGKFMEDAKS